MFASDWRAEHRLRQGEEALAAGQVARAERLAGRLDAGWIRARAARLQAAADLRQGDLQAAERHLAAAIGDAPNDWSLYRDRAVILQRLGRRAEASRAIGRALRLNPRMLLPAGFVS